VDGPVTSAASEAGALSPGPWRVATVVDVRDETTTAKTFRFRLGGPPGHRAGQHFIVRLTAPDGYRAMRSYSVASPPDDSNELELTVERLPDGEVSTFLHDVVVVGDELELRGPVGGYFVWDGATPALLVGGGSGVVPLMAMLRLARATGREALLRALVSVRSRDELYYAGEIDGPETTVIYTRTAPPGSDRSVGRMTSADLAPLLRHDATAYVCGSTPFTEAAGRLLVDAGIPAERIKIERFGPTG
jgi:ferredoxin-NADP reductase